VIYNTSYIPCFFYSRRIASPQ